MQKQTRARILAGISAWVLLTNVIGGVTAGVLCLQGIHARFSP